MAIDFPNSPAAGDKYTANGRTWTYDGAKWTLLVTSSSSSLPDYNTAFLLMGA